MDRFLASYLPHEVYRHARELPLLARVRDVTLLLDGVLPCPHPKVCRKEEVIAWELDKLRVLKEHEPDLGPHVPEAEK